MTTAAKTVIIMKIIIALSIVMTEERKKERK